MSVYIPNLDMPNTCVECFFDRSRLHRENGIVVGVVYACELLNKATDVEKLDDCPLVAVPKHGRLIDADNLDYVSVSIDKRGCVSKIDAPTIIPADKEKST